MLIFAALARRIRFLYRAGTEVVSWVYGYSTPYTFFTRDKFAQYMQLTTTGSLGLDTEVSWVTDIAVPIRGATRLKIDWETFGNEYSVLVISTEKMMPFSTYSLRLVRSDTSGGRVIDSIDISGLAEGSYYIRVHSFNFPGDYSSTQIDIHRVWLE